MRQKEKEQKLKYKKLKYKKLTKLAKTKKTTSIFQKSLIIAKFRTL